MKKVFLFHYSNAESLLTLTGFLYQGKKPRIFWFQCNPPLNDPLEKRNHNLKFCIKKILRCENFTQKKHCFFFHFSRHTSKEWIRWILHALNFNQMQYFTCLAVRKAKIPKWCSWHILALPVQEFLPNLCCRTHPCSRISSLLSILKSICAIFLEESWL